MPTESRRPVTRPAGPGASSTPAWARTLVRLLDDGLTIPGTRIGVGLDAIVGFLLPTIGDAATGVASLALLLLAFQMRVPKVVLLRMVFNIVLDSVVGMIPILGDLFDVFWRSNRRNLELIERYDKNPSRRATVADYAVVGLGIAFVLAAIVLPLWAGLFVLHWLWQRAHG